MTKEKEMSGTDKTLKDYLKKPYSRILIPDSESRTYTAVIQEFPGCIAQGNSAQEAYDLLDKAALSWIEASLDLGHDIPEPSCASEYSGKIALRLPKSLHKQLTEAAKRDDVSLNQFIVMAISEQIGSSTLYDRLVRKLEQRILKPNVNVLYISDNILKLQPTSSSFGLGLWRQLSGAEFTRVTPLLAGLQKDTRTEVKLNS